MQGYSLIELLMALAISTIMASVAMPSFKQQTSSLLLQQEAARWLSYLQQVQAKSQNNNESIAINLATLDSSSRIRVESTYSSSSPLTFYGDSSVATPGHIKLMTNERQVKIIISSIARIRSCLSGGSSLPGMPAC